MWSRRAAPACLHISVHAGDPKGGDLQQTTDCLVVFVAVDEKGQPVPVPAFVPVTDEQSASPNTRWT